MQYPLQYQGDGQFTAPKGFAKRCDKDFVIGEQLRWEPVNERSEASHRHYFACIADAWGNLPEALAPDFPNPETLRKYALIKAGYCTMRRVVCADNREAVTMCQIISSTDKFAICNIEGRTATVWQAESQSIKAMGKTKFQESKDAVLQVISDLIGADATKAGMAA